LHRAGHCASLRTIQRKARAMTSDRLTLTMADGIAEVALNRPDKLNAMDEAMFDALSTAGRELARRDGLRAVILRGEGRGFCAGIDTALLMQFATGWTSCASRS
jgi:enoyl-CoA hydratase/carnithine racemase